MRIVLDASVALKWFHTESDTPRADAIRTALMEGTISVRVPDLILYELTNALVWKVKTDPRLAIEMLTAIEQLPWLIITPTQKILKTAATIASEYKISVYDATYVALITDDSDRKLVTADEKLIAKLQHPQIIHLNAFETQTK